MTNNIDWSAKIKQELDNPDSCDLLNLIQELVSTEDIYLVEEFVIEAMVMRDRQYIFDELCRGIQTKSFLLDSVLKGEGWIPYSQLTLRKNIMNFIEDQDLLENMFDEGDREIAVNLLLNALDDLL